MEKYRLLVYGSRDIPVTDARHHIHEWSSQFSFDHIDYVISGLARGVDTIWADFAASFGLPIMGFPVRGPHWDHIGRSAGHRRNVWMLDLGQPTHALGIWDGNSPGTQGMRSHIDRRPRITHRFIDLSKGG